jgi:hypothetical protein
MPVSISVEGERPDNRGVLGLGHVIFTVSHVAALYFGAPYLLITISSHLIYMAVALAKQDGGVRRPNKRALCTECNEVILDGGDVCERCRCKPFPTANLSLRSGESLVRNRSAKPVHY